MNKDVKYQYKTSYRINGRIKSIIGDVFKDIRKKSGLDLSLGKISRTFWVSLETDPDLRKKFVNCVCKAALEEVAKKYNKYYYADQKRPGYRQTNATKRKSLH